MASKRRKAEGAAPARRPPPGGDDGGALSRGDWLRAAARALAEEGPGAVRVEALARALGVTKGSFYWHFRDRRALLDGLVEAWRRAGTTAIIDAVEARGGSPHERLAHLWELTSTADDFPLELALRDLARRDDVVAQAVAEVDAARLGYVRRLLRAAGFSRVEAEGRALALYALLVGDQLIAPAHGGLTRATVLRAAFAALTGRAADG